MDVLFPFGFPTPTAFYLSMYLLTFVLHQIFMHYVLAGTLFVAGTAAFPGRGVQPRFHQPIAAMLRDWMPFLLSAAITAGVAPLLFIQIVYQHQFYAANLLLWWRWMLVVPVLIVAFYLLYLLKSSRLWTWPAAVRAGVSLLTASCFVFVGFCWTIIHLLANKQASWTEVYATGKLPFHAGEVVARVFIWIGGSFATMSVMIGWQLLFRRDPSSAESEVEQLPRGEFTNHARILGRLACGGLSVAVVASLAYFGQQGAEIRQMLFGPNMVLYSLMTIAGLVLQGLGWAGLWRSMKLKFSGLVIATAGVFLTLTGVCVIREGIRIRSIDLASLASVHADAAKVGGFGVFVISSVIVIGLMVWCIKLVRDEIAV